MQLIGVRIVYVAIYSICFYQSGRLDSNQRPPRPERGALPGCATTREPMHLQIWVIIFKRQTVTENLPDRILGVN